MYNFILIFACVACVGVGYGVYEFIWALRIRKIRKEYRNMSEKELREKKSELSRKLHDFFGLKTSRGRCMPDKMLRLKHRCLVEEFEYRNLPE